MAWVVIALWLLSVFAPTIAGVIPAVAFGLTTGRRGALEAAKRADDLDEYLASLTEDERRQVDEASEVLEAERRAFITSGGARSKRERRADAARKDGAP